MTCYFWKKIGMPIDVGGQFGQCWTRQQNRRCHVDQHAHHNDHYRRWSYMTITNNYIKVVGNQHGWAKKCLRIWKKKDHIGIWQRLFCCLVQHCPNCPPTSIGKSIFFSKITCHFPGLFFLQKFYWKLQKQGGGAAAAALIPSHPIIPFHLIWWHHMITQGVAK